jgi:hypothetical protein
MAFQNLTISNAAVSLDSTKYLNAAGNAVRAFLTMEGASVRYRYDGVAPTASIGHVIEAGGFLVIEGQNQMENIQFIRSGANNATAMVTFERE